MSSTNGAPEAQEGAAERPALVRMLGHPGVWLALVALTFGLPILRAVRAPIPAELPVLGQVPEFSLTNHQGRSYGSEQLRGKVWTANVIFTRCPTICPAITEQLQDVQKHTQGLGDAFRLVSFTADPEYDVPEVLAEYARAHRTSSSRWLYVTGTPEELERVVRGGLKLGAGEDEGAPYGIFHSSSVVLVDAALRVRGYYDSSDPEAMDRLLRDIGLVANFSA